MISIIAMMNWKTRIIITTIFLTLAGCFMLVPLVILFFIPNLIGFCISIGLSAILGIYAIASLSIASAIAG